METTRLVLSQPAMGLTRRQVPSLGFKRRAFPLAQQLSLARGRFGFDLEFASS
jgi:hypothetical protein